MVVGSAAELAYDKRTHKKLFTGEIKFERFYRYLQYASLNTFIHLVDVFWDKMVELLEDDGQEKAAEWFFHNMTKEEGNWMLAHSGPGLSNTNCSLEVHWRTMKGAVLGAEGSSPSLGQEPPRSKEGGVTWPTDQTRNPSPGPALSRDQTQPSTR